MTITIPKDIYPKIVVMKAAYQFTDRTYIYLQQTESDYIIDISSKSNQYIDEEEFKNELLSQAVRYEIFKQTKDVRQLITMRALASTIVGHPQGIIPAPPDAHEDEILKDWFDNENTKV